MSEPEQQQPKEYICNDDDLGCLYDYMMAAMAGNDISELPRLWNQEIGVIKSRPHTSTPAPCNYPNKIVCPYAIVCSECNVNGIATEAARQAREQMLDVMRSLDACGCPHVMCHSGDGHDGLNCRDCVIKFIEESLRSQQQGGEQG